MFDKILGKDEFIKKLTEAGVASEVAEVEYAKIVVMFEVGFYKEVYDTLPVEEQTKLTEGLDVVMVEGDRTKFVDRIREYVKGNQDKLKLDKTKLEDAAKFAYTTYQAMYANK